MTKSRLMIVLSFVVAFAAGIASALVYHQYSRPPAHGPSWLTTELELTPDQQQAMLKIWGSQDRSGMQDEGEKRRSLQKQRDESIRTLLPADKQAEFDKIQESYSKQMADLGEQRRKNFDASVEKTKAILTPEQRKKYEQIVARGPEGRHFRGGNGGPGGPEGRGPDGHGPDGHGPDGRGPNGPEGHGPHHGMTQPSTAPSTPTTVPAN